MSVVRVKQGIQCVVHVAELDEMVPLVEDAPFDSSDAVVKEHGWAFSGNDAETVRPRRSSSVSIEEATAKPGEKRNR
jgi:hypothetical protein